MGLKSLKDVSSVSANRVIVNAEQKQNLRDRDLGFLLLPRVIIKTLEELVSSPVEWFLDDQPASDERLGWPSLF